MTPDQFVRLVDPDAQPAPVTGRRPAAPIVEKARKVGTGIASAVALLTVVSLAGGAAYAEHESRRCEGVTVQPGDTLTSIADLHGSTVADLAAANDLADIDLIVTGACLIVPRMPVASMEAAAAAPLSTEYVKAVGPLGGEQPGARALADAMTLAYPNGGLTVDPTFGVGIFNPRRARGSTSWSTHAEGRAVDFYTGDCDPAWDAVFDYLVAKAGDLGLQRVLWCDRGWDSRRGGFDPSEALEHLHDGTAAPAHLHVELSWDGAENLTMARAFAVLMDYAVAPTVAPVRQ